MFIISVRAHYDAAHFLRDYHGKCERMHGHRYEVEMALGFEEVGKGVRNFRRGDRVSFQFVQGSDGPRITGIRKAGDQ